MTITTPNSAHLSDVLAGLDTNPVVIHPGNIDERIVHNIAVAHHNGEHPAVIVGADGKPQAALVPYETYLDLLRARIQDEEREQDRLSLRKIARDKAAGRGTEISSSEDLDSFFTGLGGVAAEIVTERAAR